MVTTSWKWVGSLTQLIKFKLEKTGHLMIFRAENPSYKPIKSLVYCPDVLQFSSNIAEFSPNLSMLKT